MNTRRMWNDDASDSAAYDTMLRVVSGSVPDNAVNWDAFHARLSARAELSLARLRHRRPTLTAVATRVHEFPRRAPTSPQAAWWQHTARWSRVVVPGALAASVALLVAIRTMPKEAHLTTAPKVIASATLDRERSRAAFDSAVVGHASASLVAAPFLPSAADLLIPLGREVTH